MKEKLWTQPSVHAAIVVALWLVRREGVSWHVLPRRRGGLNTLYIVVVEALLTTALLIMTLMARYGYGGRSMLTLGIYIILPRLYDNKRIIPTLLFLAEACQASLTNSVSFDSELFYCRFCLTIIKHPIYTPQIILHLWAQSGGKRSVRRGMQLGLRVI